MYIPCYVKFNLFKFTETKNFLKYKWYESLKIR